MLDAFIIEEIRRKRREEKERVERPSVQLPLPIFPDVPPHSEEEKPSRGVVIIDMSA